MARPKLEINPDEVFRLASLQCTYREMASFFECDEKTLRNRFSAEIEKGREVGKISIRRAQFKRAVDAGSDTMLIWIGKQYLNQREPKDIDMDEASLLKTMGVKVVDGMFISSPMARIFSYVIKSASIGILFWILFLGKGNLILYLLLFAFTTLMLLLDEGLMRDHTWDHSGTLRSMALMEVVSTFALVVALAPMIGGIVPALMVMALSLGYFVLMNRYLWGTFVKPRV